MIDVNAWLDIPWYEWKYKLQIKNNLVKSLRFWKERILKNWIVRWWHIHIWIKENWKYKNIYIHQIVMLIKEWPCPDWMEVLHWDWNPANNHPDNLRYWTRKENVNDSIIHWTFIPRRYTNKWKFYWDNPKSLKVNQLSLDWVFIKEWECIKSFLKTINREKDSSISRCCKLKRKTAYWFRWEYKNK